MLPDDVSANPDEDELIGASKYLQGRTGPVCVSDKIIENNGNRERRKNETFIWGPIKASINLLIIRRKALLFCVNVLY